MSDLGVNLSSLHGTDYLVAVDRFSGYPLVHRLVRTTTRAVTGTLTQWFSLFGLPQRIRSDGGPQFCGPFEDFCKELSISHELASAYNPQSNGLAEAAVKQMKFLIDKCQAGKEDFEMALLQWRNTPRKDGSTPAAIFFHRHQRTSIPTLAHVYCP